MERYRWSVPMVVALVLIAFGCQAPVRTTDLNERRASSISIERIAMPEGPHTVVSDVYQQVTEYVFYQEEIRVTFSSPPRTDFRENLYWIQFGNQIPIGPRLGGKDSENTYTIEGRDLIIRPGTTQFPCCFSTLVLPAALWSDTTKTEQDVHIPISTALPNPLELINWLNRGSEGGVGTYLILPAVKNGPSVAYVSRDTLLEPSNGGPPVRLETGENVELLESTPTGSLVRVYHPIHPSDPLPASGFYSALATEGDFIEGIVAADALRKIPNPTNPFTYFVVARSDTDSPEGYFSPRLYAMVAPFGIADIPLSGDENFSELGLAALELMALENSRWVPGNAYWTTIYEDGREISPLEPEFHKPLQQMSNRDFNAYMERYEGYLDSARKLWMSFKVPPALNEVLEAVLDSFAKRELMQRLWLEWSRSDGAGDVSELIDRILSTFGRSPDSAEKVRQSFTAIPDLPVTESELFSYRLSLFINNFLSIPDSVRNTLEELVEESFALPH